MYQSAGRQTKPGASSPRLTVNHYSTHALPPRERHEAWTQRHWPSVAPLYTTEPLEPFDVSSRQVSLGEGLSIVEAEITSQRYERSASMLRSYDPEALNVQFLVSGRARGIAGGHSFDQTTGSLLFSDVGQTSLHESTESRSIMLSMSRSVALELGLDVQAMHGIVISSQTAVMFASHLAHIIQAAPELGPEDVPRLSRTVLDLLTLAVGASGSSARVAGGRSGIAAIRARDEIERRLGAPTLGIADLCRRLQMSRSSLHRLFAEEGGVQAYIRSRRLEAARSALLDPANRETIGGIAERLGFSDTAHLSRLFRANYGESPSDCRAATLRRDL